MISSLKKKSNMHLLLCIAHLYSPWHWFITIFKQNKLTKNTKIKMLGYSPTSKSLSFNMQLKLALFPVFNARFLQIIRKYWSNSHTYTHTREYSLWNILIHYKNAQMILIGIEQLLLQPFVLNTGTASCIHMH